MYGHYPSKDEIKQFPKWREEIFNKHQKRFKESRTNSSQGLEYWKKRELENVILHFSAKPLHEVYTTVIQDVPVSDYALLANVIGMIDHLKAVQAETDSKADGLAVAETDSKATKLTVAQIALMVVYQNNIPYGTANLKTTLKKYGVSENNDNRLSGFIRDFQESKTCGLDNPNVYIHRKKDFEAIMPYLTGAEKEKAEKDLEDVLLKGKVFDKNRIEKRKTSNKK